MSPSRAKSDRRSRFFLAPEAFSPDKELAVCEETAVVHQILHVLRLSAGDGVLLLDGQGNIYEAKLERIQKHRLEFRLCGLMVQEKLPDRAKLTSLLPLIKPARLEWALEKLTEIGVDTVQLFTSERTMVKAKGREEGHKRWQHIMQEAAEQCERLTLPALLAPLELNEYLKSNQTPRQTRLLLQERSQAPDMVSYLYNRDRAPENEIIILSGPEGGFSGDECSAIKAAGFIPVSLGSTILRAETASIIGAAIASASRESLD